jgi:hypothetical protein
MTRKPLTRTQIILLCQRQSASPILCGCGCGEPLDPVKERVVDEHVIPRRLSADGCEGERDDLANRAFYRWPCALEKTKADLAAIAKGARQGGETGQKARRDRRGGSSIKTRPDGGWPPKGSRKLGGLGFSPSRGGGA